jgi:hypothetical protein
MKLQAKGKIKRYQAEKQKELEETVVIPTREVEPAVYYKGEVRTSEIKQVWADEIEAIYAELGLSLNRPSAEDKALNIIRHLRMKAKVKLAEIS